MKKHTTRPIEDLFNTGSTGEDANILFEQYKLYVESMNKISERRNQANTFFLTLNTIYITTLTGFFSLTKQPSTRYEWIIFAGITGIIFSFIWRRLILSYEQLNTGKFRIIHALETRLPAKLFTAEWDILEQGKGKCYKPFSHVEMYVPLIFVFLYAALVIALLIELL